VSYPPTRNGRTICSEQSNPAQTRTPGADVTRFTTRPIGKKKPATPSEQVYRIALAVFVSRPQAETQIGAWWNRISTFCQMRPPFAPVSKHNDSRSSVGGEALSIHPAHCHEGLRSVDQLPVRKMILPLVVLGVHVIA